MMAKRWITAMLVLAMALTLVACAEKEVPEPEPTPGEATGLDGAVILEEKCNGVCHDLQRVEEQELDAVGWEQVIEDMRNKGADLTDDEVTALAEYLSLQE